MRKKKQKRLVYKALETPTMTFRVYETAAGRNIAKAALGRWGWHSPLTWDNKEGFGLMMKKPNMYGDRFKSTNRFVNNKMS